MTPDATPAEPLATRPQALAAVAALGVAAAAMAWLALTRGGWLDEYWTVWHSDPALPLRAAWATRWVHDAAHPPTFYALAWSLGDVTGPTLAARRLAVNALALLLVVPTVLLVRRAAGGWPLQPVLFALLVAADPFAVGYFAEHRSYFLALVAVACLVATVRVVHRAEGRVGAGPAAWLVVTALAAVNLHYTIALAGLALLGCEALWQGWHRRWRAALLAAGAELLAVGPLALNLAAGLARHAPPVVTYVPVGRGLATVGLMLAVGPAANPALLWRAAAALRRPAAPAGGRDTRSFLPVLLAALALLVAAFAGLELLEHNLVPRLLLGLIPLAAAAAGELAARRPIGRAGLAAVAGVAALVAVATAAVVARQPRWEYHVPAIRAAVARCPATRVVAVDPLALAPPGTLADMRGQRAAMALSYRLIARRWGFAVTPAPAGPAGAAARRCPTLIWLEHNFFRPDVGVAELAAAAGLPPPDPARVRRDRAGSHDLVTIAP